MLTWIRGIYHRIRQSPGASRFLAGASWSTGGAILASATSLAAAILVARALGKDVYGQYIVVQTTMTTAGVFAAFGIGTTATKYVAELKDRDPVRLAKILGISQRLSLIFSLLTVAGLVLASPFIAGTVLNSPHVIVPLALAAISVLFVTLDAFQKSVLIGVGAMKSFAVTTVVGAALAFFIITAAAHFFGLLGAACGLSVAALAQYLISRASMNGRLQALSLQVGSLDIWSEWRVIRDFALPTMIAGMLVGPAHWACQALLANQPNGYSEVAILGVAMQWFNVVTLLPAIGARVLLPLLTESFVSGRHDQSTLVLKLAVVSNLLIVAPILAGLVALSPRILAAYGTGFATGGATLTMTACVAALVVAVMPVGQTLAAEGKMWLGAGMNIGWSVIYLGCAALFIQKGSLGIAYALGIAYLCHSVWAGIFAIKHIRRVEVKISE